MAYRATYYYTSNKYLVRCLKYSILSIKRCVGNYWVEFIFLSWNFISNSVESFCVEFFYPCWAIGWSCILFLLNLFFLVIWFLILHFVIYSLSMWVFVFKKRKSIMEWPKNYSGLDWYDDMFFILNFCIRYMYFLSLKCLYFPIPFLIFWN